MDNKLKKFLEQYEAAKLDIRKAEMVLSELKPQILELLPEDKEVATEQGVFFIQKRPSWKYSPNLVKMREDLKEKEKMEQADGTAEVSYSNILYYREEQDK